jgi:hypothetical protein
MEGRDLVRVSWWSCGTEVIHTNPYVLVNMPAVTSVEVKLVGHTVIYFKGDPLAASPVRKPTSTELQVRVRFANNKWRDFSKDERCVFTVSNAKLAEVFDKHYVRTPSTGAGTNTPHGDVTITVGLVHTLRILKEK